MTGRTWYVVRLFNGRMRKPRYEYHAFRTIPAALDYAGTVLRRSGRPVKITPASPDYINNKGAVIH